MKFFGSRLIIDVLTIPFAFICLKYSSASTLLAYFAALFLHECGHIIGGRITNLRLLSIEIKPFGCLARFDSFDTAPSTSEIITASFGPAMSLVVAAFITTLKIESVFLKELCETSLSIFAINLLPVYPLDGGRIVSALLTRAMPYKKVAKTCGIFGIIISSAFIATSIYFALTESFSLSLFIFSATLLLYSIKQLISPSLYLINSVLNKGRLMNKQKYMQVNAITVPYDASNMAVLSKLSARDYNLIHYVDKNMKINKTLDEGTFIESLNATALH